jgi:hypothetical protein
MKHHVMKQQYWVQVSFLNTTSRSIGFMFQELKAKGKSPRLFLLLL